MCLEPTPKLRDGGEAGSHINHDAYAKMNSYQGRFYSHALITGAIFLGKIYAIASDSLLC